MEDTWRAAWAAVGPYVLEAVISVISAAGVFVAGWLRSRAQRLAAEETVQEIEESSTERTDAKISLAAVQMRETMGPHIKPLTLSGAEKLARQLREELEEARP